MRLSTKAQALRIAAYEQRDIPHHNCPLADPKPPTTSFTSQTRTVLAEKRSHTSHGRTTRPQIGAPRPHGQADPYSDK